jgi:hypothetical protein
MKLSTAAIEAALRQHAAKYGGRGAAVYGSYARCWRQAHEAFENGSPEAFGQLYSELRSRWQVFRSRSWNPPSARYVKRILDALPADVRRYRLRDLAKPTALMLSSVWAALTGAAAIKRNAEGPSLVAATKFLHFWNPRLFVIADRALVWNWALAHRWLRDPIREVRASLADDAPGAVRGDALFETDLGEYLALLVWGGRVLHANPAIMDAFARHVAAHCDPAPPDAREHEGAALEWLLLGLVELPPAGVTVG